MSYCTFSITNSTPERKWISSKDLSNMDPKQKKNSDLFDSSPELFPWTHPFLLNISVTKYEIVTEDGHRKGSL
jgi:hypothetical protein